MSRHNSALLNWEKSSSQTSTWIQIYAGFTELWIQYNRMEFHSDTSISVKLQENCARKTVV